MESEELSAEEGLPLMLFRGRRSGRGCLRISEVRVAAVANHGVGVIEGELANPAPLLADTPARASNLRLSRYTAK